MNDNVNNKIKNKVLKLYFFVWESSNKHVFTVTLWKINFSRKLQQNLTDFVQTTYV